MASRQRGTRARGCHCVRILNLLHHAVLALLVDQLVVEELLGGDDHRFGQAFVVTRNLDLLAVLEGLLQRVGRRRELGEFAVEFGLQLGRYLVGAAGDDVDRLVDIARFAIQIHQLARDGVVGDVLFNFHLAYRFFDS